ncbi:aryl-alcohol-oxidase from pleurotus Eryingii [Mycena capillaripes]|nr:aryl-alcohol-oxidase from pleurotus Eryingii [Mycena capillaripes]
MRLNIPRCLTLLYSAGPCLGAIYESFADLPKHQSFDFVVVGGELLFLDHFRYRLPGSLGGAAGNVIANRLTENPHFSVLVLEAGPIPEGLNYTVPLFQSFVQQPSPRDWNYTTVAQPGLNGRVLPYPRGRVLGGCTSMNGMQYVRGSKADYDRYARVTGDPGWAWDAIQPYIRKVGSFYLYFFIEDFSKAVAFRTSIGPLRRMDNTTGQFNPAVHGFHGINAVSLSGSPIGKVEFDARVLQVTQELSDHPFNLDYNSGVSLGISWSQATIKHGKRSSSFTSYLGPEFIGRSNLNVVLNAQVTRIIQTSQNPNAFLTVEFAEAREGPRHRITVSKEVIISAGSLETPKLLMNSGIGESTALANMGIQPLVNLPDVGKNLSVHTGAGFNFFVNSTDTSDDILRNETYRQILLDEWIATNGGGPLGWGGGGFESYVRLPSNSTVFELYPDPASGPDSPHFEGGASNGDRGGPPQTGHFVGGGATLVTPTSRGSIQLNTTDPFDQPLIDLGCLTTAFDVAALREGMKINLKMLSAKAWQGYILGPLNNIKNATSDADLEAYARQHALPNGHVVGTASMSPRGADYGVVDPDLLVKGVQHLRIVDASILPYVPSGNTQAPVYILAERAADLIKAKWE